MVEHLPLKQENLLAKRSNHGSFADVLKDLIAHTDLDVRSKAIRTFAVHNIPIPVIMKSEEPKFSVARKSHPPLAALPPGLTRLPRIDTSFAVNPISLEYLFPCSD